VCLLALERAKRRVNDFNIKCSGKLGAHAQANGFLAHATDK